MALRIISPLHAVVAPTPKPLGPPPPPDPPESLSPAEEDRYIADFETEYGIPQGLYGKLIKVGENSGYTATSPAGAYGRAQLMPATASDMGVDPKNPVQNLKGGAKYLKHLHEQLGDWDKAVAAYNWGIGRVKSGAEMPQGVKDYVERVTGQMADGTMTSASGAMKPVLDRALATQERDEAAYAKASQGAGEVDREFAGRLKTLGGKISDVDAQLERLNDMTPKAPDERKLPSYQAPPQQHPLQALTAAMPFILLAGSKMGRNKGLALMKSTKAMLDGVQGANDQVRKQYQEDFKAKSEELIQQASMDHEHYMDILQSLREQKGDVLGKIQVAAAATENEQLRHAALTGDLKRVADLAAIHGQFFGNALQAYRSALESEQNAIRNRMDQRRIDIEQGKLDETKRYHDESTPLKRMQAAEKLRNDVDKSPLGKAYASLDQYSHVIDNASAKIAKGETLGSQEQAAFLDAFTKIVTGGQAIRGFQLKLNTDHAGLGDKAQIALQQLGKGGPLDARMEKEMAQVVRDYTKALSTEYQGAISRADDFAKNSGVIGESGTLTPFEVDPQTLATRAGPPAGTVEDGYRFKGGDPAKPENWKKVG